jgi:hypothetical protein
MEDKPTEYAPELNHCSATEDIVLHKWVWLEEKHLGVTERLGWSHAKEEVVVTRVIRQKGLRGSLSPTPERREQTVKVYFVALSYTDVRLKMTTNRKAVIQRLGKKGTDQREMLIMKEYDQEHLHVSKQFE